MTGESNVDEQRTTSHLTRRQFLAASGAVGGALSFPVGASAAVGPAVKAHGYVAEALPILGGGFHTVIEPDSSRAGVLMAGSDTQGIKYTDSYGAPWELRESGLWRAGEYGIGAIAHHPKQDDTYYALSGRVSATSTSSGVYVTVDNGLHWQLRYEGILVAPQAPKPMLRVYGRLLAIDASQAEDVLYAASYNKGLYKSSDGGRTWTVVGLSGWNLTAVVLHPRDPQTIYVGARVDSDDYTAAVGGVFRSTDGGRSWAQLVDRLPVRDLVIDPHNTGHLYVAVLNAGVHRSVDAGATWEDVTNGLPLTTPAGDPTYYNAVECNRHCPGEVLVGTGLGHVPGGYGSVYRSRDGGGSWVDLVATGTLHNTDELFVGAGYFMGGAGYAVAGIRVPDWDPASIYVTGRSGIWRSENRGADWYPIFLGLQGVQVFDLAISPVTQRLYAAIADFTLLRSDPEKQHYQKFPLTADFTGDLRALCVDTSTARVLVGAGAQYLGRGNFGTVFVESADGTSWIQTGKGLPVRRVVGLASAPSNPDVVYAALALTGVFKSVDGGGTFVDISAGLPDPGTMFPQSFTKPPIAVHPHDPNTVYIMDQISGVHMSKDGGRSWMSLTGKIPTSGSAPYQGFALDPRRPERLYLGTSTGLYRSRDGGMSWCRETIPYTVTFGPITVDARTGTVFVTALPIDGYPGELRPGIYASGGGGGRWRGIYVDGPDGVNINALVTDPNARDVVYFGTDGGVFRLRHGGHRR